MERGGQVSRGSRPVQAGVPGNPVIIPAERAIHHGFHSSKGGEPKSRKSRRGNAESFTAKSSSASPRKQHKNIAWVMVDVVMVFSSEQLFLYARAWRYSWE